MLKCMDKWSSPEGSYKISPIMSLKEKNEQVKHEQT